MDNIKVSIITVCYNSEKTIKDTLNSVLAQTYPNIEYIVVDGGSEDRTISILENYEEKFKSSGIKFLWKSEKDNGIYDAMNKGVSLSNGKLVGIINSDDWYEKNTIETIVKEYSNENSDVIYGDIRIIKVNGEKKIKRSKLTKGFSTRNWNHPTTFIKKRVYEKYQYKLESINDDLDLMLKLKKDSNLKFSVVNKILANFRLGGVSNTKELKQTFKNIKNRNNIYRNNKYSRLYYLDNLIIEVGKFILS